jgi:hypothetical protein
MYRFDDKRRRQLLEDALVADLLDARAGSNGRASTERPPVVPAAAPVGAGGAPKRST